MKIIHASEVSNEKKPYGRETKALFEHVFNKPAESIVFYLSSLPTGQFDEHYHSESEEIIWFPEGGEINVEGTNYRMGPWDAVFLESGERHGFKGNCGKTVHFAVKIPASKDKVSTET